MITSICHDDSDVLSRTQTKSDGLVISATLPDARSPKPRHKLPTTDRYQLSHKPQLPTARTTSSAITTLNYHVHPDAPPPKPYHN